MVLGDLDYRGLICDFITNRPNIFGWVGRKELKMLSSEEQSYLDKRPMKRLTFDGINDLYQHPLYGAYTIKQCIEKEALKLPKPRVRPEIIWVSDEMERRNEDCIDRYGCGLY